MGVLNLLRRASNPNIKIPTGDRDQLINVFNKVVARLDGDRGTSIAGYCKAITALTSAKTSLSSSNLA